MTYTQWEIGRYFSADQETIAHYEIWEGETLIVANVPTLEHAQRIVLDHNCHDDLLEALQSIKEHFALDWDDPEYVIFAQAEAAIAKATKETK